LTPPRPQQPPPQQAQQPQPAASLSEELLLAVDAAFPDNNGRTLAANSLAKALLLAGTGVAPFAGGARAPPTRAELSACRLPFEAARVVIAMGRAGPAADDIAALVRDAPQSVSDDAVLIVVRATDARSGRRLMHLVPGRSGGGRADSAITLDVDALLLRA
jgi:hypothetical protein